MKREFLDYVEDVIEAMSNSEEFAQLTFSSKKYLRIRPRNN